MTLGSFIIDFLHLNIKLYSILDAVDCLEQVNVRDGTLFASGEGSSFRMCNVLNNWQRSHRYTVSYTIVFMGHRPVTYIVRSHCQLHCCAYINWLGAMLLIAFCFTET